MGAALRDWVVQLWDLPELIAGHPVGIREFAGNRENTHKPGHTEFLDKIQEAAIDFFFKASFTFLKVIQICLLSAL